MKIMTVLGTRPEIIRLSRIIPKLDLHCEHALTHTGQNYDDCLSDVFFSQMGIRRPDSFLSARGESFGERAGDILSKVDDKLVKYKPDRLLILGDTDSGLSAIAAKRRGIPVYHMEAGNRCYDDCVPEEINRRVIDHCSDLLMPYTSRSRENLLAEGIPGRRIMVTGNPIWEVIQYYNKGIQQSVVLGTLGLGRGTYYLVTAHRAETVDDPDKLRSLCTTLERLACLGPVVFSVHPHTRSRLEQAGLAIEAGGVKLIDPPGFFDFVTLERYAKCVLSDSGTVQEECCLLGKPCVVLRDVTERPETIECGSGVLANVDPDRVIPAVKLMASRFGWTSPAEYSASNVSDRVLSILLGVSP